MSVAVILVAAGRGERLGAGLPKALVPVAGITLLEHAISRAIETSSITELVVTATPGHEIEFSSLAEPLVPDQIKLTVVTGGATRQQSIALALAEVSSEPAVVLVHDAARAFTPTSVFDRVVDKVLISVGGVLPVLPVHDTIKRVNGETVEETVDRSELRIAQTPQGFPAALLREAYAKAAEEHTDDASLVQAQGHKVAAVPGDRMAMKVTTADDLVLANLLVGGAQRTGIGTDTHRFTEVAEKPLYLGTIVWEGELGLDGHSDGDALSHAIVDAMLSAAGLGDIGSNFGVDRPEFSGANGKVFIEGALELLLQHGWSVVNVSAQIIGNKPKVAPMRERVEAALTQIVHAPVTISATTTDGLGFLGNTEGVAVVATALIQRKDK